MLKDLDAPLIDTDDKPLMDKTPEGVDRPATVRSFAVNALALLNKEQITGEEKMNRYKLAMKLKKGGKKDMKPEELSLIKKTVGDMYPPLVVGQIWEWADSSGDKAEPEVPEEKPEQKAEGPTNGEPEAVPVGAETAHE